MQKLCPSSALDTDAVQKFKAIYEKHYVIALSLQEAEAKFRAFLGLLAAVRAGTSTSGAAPCGERHETSALPQRAQEADPALCLRAPLTVNFAIPRSTAE